MHVIVILQMAGVLLVIMDWTSFNSSENGFKSYVPGGVQTRLEDWRHVCILRIVRRKREARQSQRGLWGRDDFWFKAAGVTSVK